MGRKGLPLVAREHHRRIVWTQAARIRGNAADMASADVKQDTKESSEHISIKVKKGTALKKLMNAFCQRQSLNMSQIVFLYDGARITPENTAEELGLEEGDEIDAMISRMGGRL